MWAHFLVKSIYSLYQATIFPLFFISYWLLYSHIQCELIHTFSSTVNYFVSMIKRTRYMHIFWINSYVEDSSFSFNKSMCQWISMVNNTFNSELKKPQLYRKRRKNKSEKVEMSVLLRITNSLSPLYSINYYFGNL